jgi:peptidoglycan/LPS O-acetylase OafA/YrhL
MAILPSYVEYHPLLRIGYFLAGILAYFIISFPSVSLENFVKKYASFLAFISIAIILLIMATVSGDWQVYLRSGMLLPFYFSLFMALAYLKDAQLKFLSNKTFVFLGAISFGIYIFQYPVQLFYENSIHSINTYEHFVWYSVVLIIICSGIYLLYEAPLNNWIRNKFKQSQ